MKCTMKKIAGVIALTAMLSTVALPVFAAENADGKISVTYKANSATTDNADWLVSYPKTVTVSDYNSEAAKGVSLEFKLFDKNSSDSVNKDYSGSRTVTVAIAEYNNGGITMNQGTGAKGSATLGMAVGTTELGPTSLTIKDLKKGDSTGTAKAFLKTSDKAEGTFNADVSFTFKDNSTGV